MGNPPIRRVKVIGLNKNGNGFRQEQSHGSILDRDRVAAPSSHCRGLSKCS